MKYKYTLLLALTFNIMQPMENNETLVTLYFYKKPTHITSLGCQELLNEDYQKLIENKEIEPSNTLKLTTENFYKLSNRFTALPFYDGSKSSKFINFTEITKKEFEILSREKISLQGLTLSEICFLAKAADFLGMEKFEKKILHKGIKQYIKNPLFQLMWKNPQDQQQLLESAQEILNSVKVSEEIRENAQQKFAQEVVLKHLGSRTVQKSLLRSLPVVIDPYSYDTVNKIKMYSLPLAMSGKDHDSIAYYQEDGKSLCIPRSVRGIFGTETRYDNSHEEQYITVCTKGNITTKNPTTIKIQVDKIINYLKFRDNGILLCASAKCRPPEKDTVTPEIHTSETIYVIDAQCGDVLRHNTESDVLLCEIDKQGTHIATLHQIGNTHSIKIWSTQEKAQTNDSPHTKTTDTFFWKPEQKPQTTLSLVAKKDIGLPNEKFSSIKINSDNKTVTFLGESRIHIFNYESENPIKTLTLPDWYKHVMKEKDSSIITLSTKQNNNILMVYDMDKDTSVTKECSGIQKIKIIPGHIIGVGPEKLLFWNSELDECKQILLKEKVLPYKITPISQKELLLTYTDKIIKINIPEGIKEEFPTKTTANSHFYHRIIPQFAHGKHSWREFSGYPSNIPRKGSVLYFWPNGIFSRLFASKYQSFSLIDPRRLKQVTLDDVLACKK